MFGVNSLTRKLVSISFLILALLSSSQSFAQTVVLSQTIGKSTVKNLISSTDKKHIQYAGMNKYSNGKMYSVQGQAYGVAGLSNALFIFDQQDLLSGVVLTMDKNRFDDIKKILDEKYRLVSSQVPFVGNKSAKYRDGDVQIEINSPHLQFEMSVIYLNEKLRKNFEMISASESQEKARRESSKF